jgi:uncharacterized protein (TIGR03067 family)
MLCATIGWNVISIMLAAVPASAAPDDEAFKPDDLVGVYEIVSGEKFGVDEPEDRIKGSTVRFTKDRVVVVDKEEKEVYGATYKLGPAEGAPEHGARTIVLTSKLAAQEDQVARGLIEKAGDKVQLIYAIPGGEAPKGFKTKDKQLMFVLKKRAS